MYIEFNPDRTQVLCTSEEISDEAIGDLEIILQIMKSSKQAVLLSEEQKFNQEQVKMAIEIVKTIAENDEAIIQLKDETCS